MKNITKFEFTDWTLAHPDAFQSCDVAAFDECYTGCGDSPYEAATDALKQCFRAGNTWSSELLDELEAVLTEFSGQGDELDEDDKRLYYVSLRVKLRENEP